MTIASDDIRQLIRLDTGEIDRRIFVDEEIFELEMREIFGRAWLFLCHETQIPKPGDFFEATMGRDNVLVVRQRDRSIKAFLNTCTHRGNAVCRAEEGNTRNFMCTYHGWTFDLAGDLVGVPGMETYYGNRLDKSKHGLKKVSQLDSYKGFVFATFDPTAPPLEEFLGATGRLSIDLLAERADEMEVIPGVQKFIVDCNWKLPTDNIPDWYHPQITHMSAVSSDVLPGLRVQEEIVDGGGAKTPDGQRIEQLPQGRFTVTDCVTVLGEYGHYIGGPRNGPRDEATPRPWRTRPGFVEAVGPVGMEANGHPSIFPHLWIVTSSGQVSVRIPRAANKTEIWWWGFRPKNASDEEKAMLLAHQTHVFGPAGILEQEDGENWAQGTMHSYGEHSSQIPHLLKMNIGHGQVIHEHGLARIESALNEHPQLWQYASWQAWISGASWDELLRRTTPGDRM
ncbi:aromatic ring-hydroxylating oxygenase subunit alpha [Granulicoccus phenolivorans]|uniref:aromatic ring-hydroxylating oxygenase subunit alpha n=1 Tax=Granulicoccus phenolivorans TaxID=266854 RepID=UPI0004228ACD|nr:aromatic ring-hydroxylating dioxygenase subunit alpha [Granulicoccus phenolivorans]